MGRPRRSEPGRVGGPASGRQTVGAAVGEAGWSLAGTSDPTSDPCTATHQRLHRSCTGLGSVLLGEVDDDGRVSRLIVRGDAF